MKQDHVVIISDSIKFRKELAHYLKTKQNQFIISSYSYADVYRALNTASDAVIIADADSDIAAAEEIASTLRKCMPQSKLLVVSQRADSVLAKYLKKINAVLIPKPVCPEVIRLNIFRNTERFEIRHGNNETEQIVASFLLYMRIPPSTKGFIFLKSAIAHVIDTHALSSGFSMKNVIYPCLKTKFGVSESCSERAMRYAVSAYVIPSVKAGLTDYVYFTKELTCRGFITASAYYLNDIMTYGKVKSATFGNLIDESEYILYGNI